MTQLRAGGHTLYWGPVNQFTPFYMALIDPFPRHLIYPALIRCLETAWREQWHSQALPHRP